MYEPDYIGDMEFYQDQLAKKGITKEMIDMDNFVGLTDRELQSIVDSVHLSSVAINDLRKEAV